MTERGADFDAKREAYERARVRLAWIINNPDKTVSVAEYREQFRRASDVSERTHKDMMGA